MILGLMFLVSSWFGNANAMCLVTTAWAASVYTIEWHVFSVSTRWPTEIDCFFHEPQWPTEIKEFCSIFCRRRLADGS
jgi:hypothetical protein